MPQLLGEYECKIDSKGRMRMPSQLIRQLGSEGTQTFVVNRGIEKCLNLYPKTVWDQLSAKVNSLNTYVKKNREFIRYFYRGASELSLDGSDRLLISKRLLEYAGVGKDVVLFAVNDHIEIWASDQYDSQMETEPEDFSGLAEEVMGGQDPAENGEP
ncbi:MAG: division/cell wall cluster transcriptional repressor MraZ [Bacteroidota bacterium]